MPDYNRYELPDEEVERFQRHPSSAVFLRALAERGCVPQLHEGMRISFRNARGKTVWFNGSNTSLNPRPARRLCINKMATKAFLRAAGANTPRGDVFSHDQTEEALRYARFLGFPVVVKPVDGMAGKSVYSGITSKDGFLTAWSAQPAEQAILVEKHVEGEDYRAYVLDGQVLAIARRDPPAVVGDGKTTLGDMIDGLNRRRRESGNPIHRQIQLRGIVADHIARQGLSASSVCDDGTVILLRPNANISTGGTVIDVTDDAPAPVMREATKAASAIPGLRVVGLDILYRDGWPVHVLEMNHNPMLSLHHFPWVGRERNVAQALVEAMLNS